MNIFNFDHLCNKKSLLHTSTIFSTLIDSMTRKYIFSFKINCLFIKNMFLTFLHISLFKDSLENFFDRILFMHFNVSDIFINKTLSFQRFRSKTNEKHIKQSEN